jgi:hypothetical protein
MSDEDTDRTFEIIESRSSRPDPAPSGLTRKHDGFTRQDVVLAYARAFQMIGGVPRLALWANANPDKFFPLFAKFQPSTTIVVGDNSTVEILHAIPRTDLDDHGPGTPTQAGDPSP